MIRNRVGGDFCEDAFGRDGHDHVSKSKETLYLKKIFNHITEKAPILSTIPYRHLFRYNFYHVHDL
jgi:hypothetical protein